MTVIEPTTEAPVSIGKHYEILRFVEQAVSAELQKVKDHRWMPIGTRVTYRLAGEKGLPPGKEYRLDCGHLDPLDDAPVVEVSEKEWYAIRNEESDIDPLTIDFVDELCEKVKGQLQAATEKALRVTIAWVLAGSPTSVGGTGCLCCGGDCKGYYKKNKLHCLTTVSC